MVSPTSVLRCGDRLLELGKRTYVMGIVNTTPDSFSDGGLHVRPEDAIAHALRLIDEGADVVDIGGESTRPGSTPVDASEERRRVLPVVEGLVKRGITNISIDTQKANVAEECLQAGAAWINDVSALRHDPRMLEVCSSAQAVVLMHAKAMDDTEYIDVVEEVHAFLRGRAAASGLRSVIVDPGIGFGKTTEQNIELTRSLSRFKTIAPVLYGPSRKRWIGAITGVEQAALRDAGTHGAIAYAALHGADIVRVHDVRGAVECLRVVDALRSSGVVTR